MNKIESRIVKILSNLDVGLFFIILIPCKISINRIMIRIIMFTGFLILQNDSLVTILRQSLGQVVSVSSTPQNPFPQEHLEGSSILSSWIGVPMIV